MTRYHVHYTGNVQGVGFRYTASRIARRYDVAGYVQNLADGGVRLVAEGEPAELDAFLEDIRDAMGRHIDEANLDKAPATGEFGSPGDVDTFTVRY
ncbi:MAG: acylphosphatase [Phycisphaeraceae bacterium]